MSLSRRGFLTALASAPIAAAVPPAPMKARPVLQAVGLASSVQEFVIPGPARVEQVAVNGLTVWREPAVVADVGASPALPGLPPEPEPIDMNLIDFLNSVNGQAWTEDRHCLAFAEEVQRRFFGRALPLPALPRSPGERHVAIHTDPARTQWTEVDGPAHGAIVLMSPRAEDRIDCHIGVCLLVPEPVVAHTDRPQGVCVDDLMTLRARGWHPTFWMPA